MVKKLLPMQEMQVRPLGWEDPLEKEMPSQSSILPGKSHGQRNLVDYSPWGRKELGKTKQLSTQPTVTPVLVNRGLDAGTGRSHVKMEAEMGVRRPWGPQSH